METFAPDMKNLSAALNAQSEILSNLSATLAGSFTVMKNSFDSFMRDVGKNFSANFIAEVNAAVREVVTWQREYKNIVELTTAQINQTSRPSSSRTFLP